ncbi:hypothetical protein PMY56_14465 [Clostridium tertium]|uniref:hypothetical protein n=1 Tax=Clostridium tertium TaxID=1559 RepID=UPI000BE4530D|nr:hypothetical protein [Clostridium tertium]MDB1924140.1 hypothetical protein [Clostridium tertium]MDB1927339.1 hypothetical protein [Clostridium tertium]MDB1931115.1 hypothetical protein [Clostridium tertium]
MIKAMTIREFVILKYIKENFDMDCINIRSLGGDEMMITDFDGVSMIFGYDLEKGVIEIE